MQASEDFIKEIESYTFENADRLDDKLRLKKNTGEAVTEEERFMEAERKLTEMLKVLATRKLNKKKNHKVEQIETLTILNQFD